MPLADELDVTIKTVHHRIKKLESELEALRREMARQRQIEVDALRLYRSATGSTHPLESGMSGPERERPREGQIIGVMEAAGRPVTLAELVDAMPDNPDRGAISAVVHRAIKRGEVRRLRRGVYELVGRFAKAS